ncbi:uncharacterized protein VP01_3123g4 [Puccinia sorghi]|uniref:Tf2-1-like SH3-like domain-containing protein n=1 Tax=Puccinia sorghi TaxID=27349 RepID=A0A0L6UZ91_9BASI|nr:uncharacterized protein VP01_3123g4 [Puccinia sorghi]
MSNRNPGSSLECKVPQYKACYWVWLSSRNILSQKPSSKLYFKQLGIFRIDISMGKDFYLLILLKDLSCIHPVFHKSLLLPFLDPASFPVCIYSELLVDNPHWNHTFRKKMMLKQY